MIDKIGKEGVMDRIVDFASRLQDALSRISLPVALSQEEINKTLSRFNGGTVVFNEFYNNGKQTSAEIVNVRYESAKKRIVFELRSLVDVEREAVVQERHIYRIQVSDALLAKLGSCVDQNGFLTIFGSPEPGMANVLTLYYESVVQEDESTVSEA